MLSLLAVRDTLDVAVCIYVFRYTLWDIKTPVQLFVSTGHGLHVQEHFCFLGWGTFISVESVLKNLRKNVPSDVVSNRNCNFQFESKNHIEKHLCKNMWTHFGQIWILCSILKWLVY